jgi:hypothetical protein
MAAPPSGSRPRGLRAAQAEGSPVGRTGNRDSSKGSDCNLRLSVRAPLDKITIAVLDGFRTQAEVPITPEQAERIAEDLLKAARRTSRGAS